MTRGDIKCPECGFVQYEEIPENACKAFTICRSCGARIAAKKNCCVFCDYGTTPCPYSTKHEK